MYTSIWGGGGTSTGSQGRLSLERDESLRSRGKDGRAPRNGLEKELKVNVTSEGREKGLILVVPCDDFSKILRFLYNDSLSCILHL